MGRFEQPNNPNHKMWQNCKSNDCKRRLHGKSFAMQNLYNAAAVTFKVLRSAISRATLDTCYKCVLRKLFKALPWAQLVIDKLKYSSRTKTILTPFAQARKFKLSILDL